MNGPAPNPNAEAQNFTRHLVNEPSNQMTPTHLAQ